MKKEIISPIAIDLGAKNTGVFFAHYEAGSRLDQIGKSGKVYQLDGNSYTYLMVDRTAKRHQKRGYDRRQMAKRLFRLIWEKHFKFSWDRDVQQTISFLLNRRGFSYLTEEYDPAVLQEMPKEAKKLICDVLKLPLSNGPNFHELLMEWTNEGESSVGKKYQAIEKETDKFKEVKGEIGRINALSKYCAPEQGSNRKPKKPVKVSQDLLKKWKSAGIQGLPDTSENWVDIANYLDEKSPASKKKIHASLQSTGYLDSLKQEQKRLEGTVWGFDPVKFELDEFEKVDESEEGNGDDEVVKIHLRHFSFALHKTLNELQSGGRHRSKYFEEIGNVLNGKKHKEKYLKKFCGKLQSGEYKPLTVETLTHLLGHVSNLELKPLRKYFNDKKHRGKDYWDEPRLNKLVARWMMKEWRVGEKDGDKADDSANFSYKNLKEKWKGKKGSVVDFWLKTDPRFTIPPYQDNNNRRPPRCQSLLLNVQYLNRKYPGWRGWLDQLKDLEGVAVHLGSGENEMSGSRDYERVLRDLKSGKDNRYFGTKATGDLKRDSGRRTMEELDARVLHFVLDRVKAEDPLRLNEIYSRAKPIRQGHTDKETKVKLERVLKASDLPDSLKSNPSGNADVFPDGSFLHFVCAYYRDRQRAKDGRIFIHPAYRQVDGRGYENTGRFDDKDSLLTYCNHKPRQKRYQMLGDIAALFQVSPDRLRKHLDSHESTTSDNDVVIRWLEGVDGLKSNCERAAKEQKERRGILKQDIQRIYDRIYHEGAEGTAAIRRALAASRIRDAYKLYTFCERAIRIRNGLISGLVLGEEGSLSADQPGWKSATDAVYLLAQLNNIVFKERQGNANTCAVCSADNAQRMQTVSGNDGSDHIARAQRLPAIATRVIDGAVRRIARIVGGEIAKHKWNEIKEALEQGSSIRVPIVTESNQFEFEPSREELVKGKRTPPSGSEDAAHQSKEQRIREAGNDTCPYMGTRIDADAGQMDHILPRTSDYGTINDEANLIYTSEPGNQRKGNSAYFLGDLDDGYKTNLFGTTDPQEIQRQIEEQLGDGKGDNFSFGQYRSFINLSSEEQKAFRHALFLPEGNELRNKVINAISNRNRAFVNGTQRYFADVVANNLHKLAKDIGREKQISFDFVGVDARSGSSGESIYDLRKLYERDGYLEAVNRCIKQEGHPQKPYSHLLDAQLAFIIAADAHRKEGGFKLQLDEREHRGPLVDKGTGEYKKGMLEDILIDDDGFAPTPLGRRDAYEVETHHRELLNKGKDHEVHISYQIHRDTYYAERFFRLIELDDGSIRMGFSETNSASVKGGTGKLLKKHLALLKQEFLMPISGRKGTWQVKKTVALNYLVRLGSEGGNEQEQEVARVLDSLCYQTVKKSIQSVLTQGTKVPQTVSDALAVWESCITKAKFTKVGIVLPVFSEWQKLEQELKEGEQEQPLQDFLRDCKLFNTQHESNVSMHRKVRKVYSLPTLASTGSVRLRRRSWDGEEIIQNAADEGLAKYGLDGKDRPHTILSKNSVPVGHYTGVQSSLAPKPRAWIGIPDEFISNYNRSGTGDNAPPSLQIDSGKVKHKDAGRCEVKLLVKASDIDKLSLPDVDGAWKGKLKQHKNKGQRDKATENERGNTAHFTESEWQWFEKPFSLPTDRNQVDIRKDGHLYEIHFTVTSTKEIKGWLTQ